MILKRLVLLIGFIAFFTPCLFAAKEQKPAVKKDQTQEADQQISEFSLTGYGEKGKKNWDLAGKSADIFIDVVKLTDVVGNLYGKEEDIKLTADRGDFSKTDGKVHLEQNVVVTTSSGTKLTTDSLDWDRKNQLVTTDDIVNIKRENMVTVARGAKGEPSLKKVALKKDVQVDINPVDPQKGEAGVAEKIVITCDGPLEIDYEKNIATFNNNVKVLREDSTIYSDKMDIYFLSSGGGVATKEKKESAQTPGFMGSKIDKIVARGNVKVIRGENTSYSQEAIYSAKDKKLILSGRPKLIIYSTEEFGNASLGN
ncbi:MAG: LPS export ABC transporter periplasmic protein LptC [Candidatus Omnitrophica bacterium]|nr:LPS export ABC transporter periplasmic protein LptC [Candidatus Omnitrophota bacterium]MDD5238736.1 LPS export ABC transporter periplasmic protein LptC [Candidatus Omnitrophota bacterium]